MTHQQKQTAITAVSSVLATIPYLIYMVNRYQNENLDADGQLVFWATALLILIPIRIVVQILVSILFGIFLGAINPKNLIETSDERDKLISLYSSQVRDAIVSMGVVVAMISTALGNGADAMICIMIMGGVTAEVCEYIAQTYMYQKGV